MIGDDTVLEGVVSLAIIRGKGPNKDGKGFGGYGYLAAVVSDKARAKYSAHALKADCAKENLHFFWKDIVDRGCFASWLHVRGLAADGIRENYVRYTDKCRDNKISPVAPPHHTICYLDTPMSYMDMAVLAFNENVLKDEDSYARLAGIVGAGHGGPGGPGGPDEELGLVTAAEEEAVVVDEGEGTSSGSTSKVNEVEAEEGVKDGGPTLEDKVKFVKTDSCAAKSLIGEAEDVLEDLKQVPDADTDTNKIFKNTFEVVVKLKEKVRLDKSMLGGMVQECEKQAACIKEFQRSAAADLAPALVSPVSNIVVAKLKPVNLKLSNVEREIMSVRSSQQQLETLIKSQMEGQAKIENLLLQLLASLANRSSMGSPFTPVSSVGGPGFSLGSTTSTPASTPTYPFPPPTATYPPPPPSMPSTAFFPGQGAMPSQGPSQGTIVHHQTRQRSASRWTPRSAQLAPLLPLSKRAKHQ